MKAYIVYKDQSDHARAVIDYMADFERHTAKKLGVVDPDSVKGDTFCRTYDIVEYPSVIALDNNGIMQNMWCGLPLPTINELSYYVE